VFNPVNIAVKMLSSFALS